MNENSRQTPFNLVLKVLVKISAYLCTENNFGNPTTVFRKRKPQRTKKTNKQETQNTPPFQVNTCGLHAAKQRSPSSSLSNSFVLL